MKRAVIVENLRSAYNVGNIIRTADALEYDVIISGYSPSPFQDHKVKKSSLGAENSVKIYEYRNTKQAIEFAKKEYGYVIACEKIDNCISLKDFENKNSQSFAILLGNEVDGVLPETLDFVDDVVHIDMKGEKESLNVGQAGAIFMRELSK